jgi:hypothetical protein
MKPISAMFLLLGAVLACHDTPTESDPALARVRSVRVVRTSFAVGPLLPGGSTQLEAYAYDSTGAVIDAPPPLEWVSDKPSVIEVDQNGRITARAVGFATVYAGVKSGVNGYRSLTVADPGAELVVNPDSSHLLLGQQRRLILQHRSTPETAIGQGWSSSNTTVATVDADGVVTAVAPGLATIGVTYGSRIFQSEIYVAPDAPPLRFATVAAGSSATCGLTTDGTAYCWGARSGGILGTTERLDRCVSYSTYTLPFGGPTGGDSYAYMRSVGSCAMEPVRVDTPLRFASLDLRGATACGLTSAGEAHCWGATGDLTGGAAGPAIVPVSAQLRFGSFSYPCGVTTSNEAWCFGDPALRGAAATASTASTPVAGGSTWAYVTGSTAVGGKHRCGLTTGGVVECWGDNTRGKLGTGDTTASSLPVPVQSTERFSAVAVNQDESCALSLSQLLYCWGKGRTSPTAVSTTQRFTTLSSSFDALCAIGTDAIAYCRTSGGAMANVAPGLQFRSMSVGVLHRCGLRDDGVAYCWGLNSSGQAGSGDNVEYRAAPARVVGQ